VVDRNVLFGAGLGAWNGADVRSAAESVRLVTQADRDGLDLFTFADHPYFGEKLDAYALLSFLLGRTERMAGAVTVTSLPGRPAPVLARTVTSLSALSGGRVVLGIGAGAIWDMIVKLGVRRLDGGSAVRAMEEAITLIRMLSGGGDPVTFDGEFYQVSGLDPADAAAPPVWTGSVGPKSLAVTGRLADGWVPSRASDWLSPLYRESRPRIDEAAAAAGRDPAQVIDVYNLGGRITPGPLAVTRDDDGRWIGGSVRQWADELTGAVLEHGAGGFIYHSTDGNLAEAQARWAREIVPAVREAIAKQPAR
jgi:alkanesulfonate monooxygenase SsuD/methylene tetrahydromethanopterin reductase-like flavin-dependent oxidoreductase (luciferase family)